MERDMTRPLLALASMIAASMAFGSAAHACLSCSYTPEVLNSPGVRSPAPERQERSSSSDRDRGSAASEERRSHVEKSTPSRHKEAKKDSGDDDTVKSDPAAKKETAKAEPEAKKEAVEARNENSAITTTGAAIANQVKAAIKAPEPTGPQTENSTISTATAASTDKPSAEKPAAQVAADKNVGCKKYFASTGLTLSVPCDR